MARKLIDDVTVQEMRHMRDNGMTNQDIANTLDVSYPTVYRYLGKQPSRGGMVSQYIPIDSKRETPPEEEHEAVLPVVNRVTYLKGAFGQYSVDAQARTVTLIVKGAMVEVEFDQWEAFASEIAAIGRNLNKQTVGVEMW